MGIYIYVWSWLSSLFQLLVFLAFKRHWKLVSVMNKLTEFKWRRYVMIGVAGCSLSLYIWHQSKISFNCFGQMMLELSQRKIPGLSWRTGTLGEAWVALWSWCFIHLVSCDINPFVNHVFGLAFCFPCAMAMLPPPSGSLGKNYAAKSGTSS